MSKSTKSVETLRCLVLLGLLSISVLAHDVSGRRETPDDAASHRQLDFGFRGFAKLNARLASEYRDFNETFNFARASGYSASVAAPDSYMVGSWSPVFSLPIVPIHIILLTNGSLLMWDSVGDGPTESYPIHNTTRAAIWDPITGTVLRVDNAGPNSTGYNLFCAGFAHLPSGMPFIAGGNRDALLDGLDVTHYFDQTNNLWLLGPTMAQGDRWYPSVTPLANGEMLITSGGPITPEVLSTGGVLRSLTSASWDMPLYPWLQAAPNGKALYFGPSDEIRYLDSAGTGGLTAILPRDTIRRSYGSYAMYDIGKIVASGGGDSSRKTVTLDIRNPNVDPVVSQTADMAFGRRQHNLTVLPDGSVLATGGNSTGATLIDMTGNVFDAELWDPATKTWRTISAASRIRQYHSTAILLPDGRVFTGGGGICGVCADVGYLEKNMEIFTPPYLYKKDGSGDLAPRPGITSAPSSAVYNETFAVGTPDAANITSAVMMRVSSVTHSVDFEQRRVPLAFTVTGGGLNVTAPPNANIAPPGMYMLFLIDSSGVPSEAKMISVQYGAALGAPLIVASSGGNSTATLAWIPVPGAAGYEVQYGTVPGAYTNSVVTGDVKTLTLTGLSAWQYYFTIRALSGAQTGGFSASATVQTNLQPTAANVSVAGRAVSPSGFGLSQVTVSISGGDLPEARTSMTNPFGYYRFNEIPAGKTYALTVSSKRYLFASSSILLSVDDDVTNADFTSQEPNMVTTNVMLGNPRKEDRER